MKKNIIIGFLFLCAITLVIIANIYDNRNCVSNSQEKQEILQEEQLDKYCTTQNNNR